MLSASSFNQAGIWQQFQVQIPSLLELLMIGMFKFLLFTFAACVMARGKILYLIKRLFISMIFLSRNCNLLSIC